MALNLELLYRAQVFARRLPYVAHNVSFVPLKSDAHVVWDVHRAYLQYRTAPPLPGKTLHVINRRPGYFEAHNFAYFAELENIFSLLPREIQLSKNYENIRSALNTLLHTPALRGLIFQSPGAHAINEQWLAGASHLKIKTITVTPAVIEPRQTTSFAASSAVSFLMFASRFYHKGLHILLPVAERLLKTKPHYTITLLTPKPITQALPANIVTKIVPRPTLAERRQWYTSHDYTLNLSLGDSLGVFLDAVRFGTPVVGYPGQHGATYCAPNNAQLLPNPIFVYGEKYLREYNAFEYEEYLKKLDGTGFFKPHSEALYECMLALDNAQNYAELVTRRRAFAQTFSPTNWHAQMREFYRLF